LPPVASQPCNPLLTITTGLDEGVHLTRALHGCTEQEGCVPRNRGLMPKVPPTLLHHDFVRPATGPSLLGGIICTVSGTAGYKYRHEHIVCIPRITTYGSVRRPEAAIARRNIPIHLVYSCTAPSLHYFVYHVMSRHCDAELLYIPFGSTCSRHATPPRPHGRAPRFRPIS
jgi:hypothetical protein